MRVVSLTCSNTEIVCALGCDNQLVGVDDHSDYPVPTVARLPKVGPDLGIDVARVSELEPDLVLASLTVPGHEKVVGEVAAAGLDYLAPSPESLADVYSDVRMIAARLGVEERGEALVTEMSSAIEPREVTGPRPAILVEWWPKPVYVPGRRSWVNDLLWAAGAHNPRAHQDDHSGAVDPQEALGYAPEAVVISWCGVETKNYRPEQVYSRSGWEQIPAVLNQQVHCVPEAFLGRPGPRLIEGYRNLSQIVASLPARGR